MIVAACLFHCVYTVQHSKTFICTNMNRIPSLLRWKALYNQPRMRHMPTMIISTVVNTPYLFIDGFICKCMFTHCFFVILARFLQWKHFPDHQYSSGLSSSWQHTIQFHSMTSVTLEGLRRVQKRISEHIAACSRREPSNMRNGNLSQALFYTLLEVIFSLLFSMRGLTILFFEQAPPIFDTLPCQFTMVLGSNEEFYLAIVEAW